MYRLAALCSIIGSKAEHLKSKLKRSHKHVFKTLTSSLLQSKTGKLALSILNSVLADLLININYKVTCKKMFRLTPNNWTQYSQTIHFNFTCSQKRVFSATHTAHPNDTDRETTHRTLYCNHSKLFLIWRVLTKHAWAIYYHALSLLPLGSRFPCVTCWLFWAVWFKMLVIRLQTTEPTQTIRFSCQGAGKRATVDISYFAGILKY